MATIAFLGLGQMGSPMANNLLQKGHSLQVFDVNAQAVDALVTQGATAAQTPAEAAAGAEFIITMLPNGDIVRQVLLGEKGVCEAVSSDALLIDMSTIHPLQTDALIRELQEKGISMMDAPVGRTSVNAIDGTLLILAGGTDEQIARARPILMCMGNELVEAGGPGMGIRVKLINNYMSIALNALSSEAAVLCESLGLNLDVAIKVMSGTAAGKGHFTTTWPCKVLKDISRPGGGFAMLAVDQREAMRLMFAAAGQPKPIADSVLTDFKVAATRILSPYASAVLADKQFCLEQIVEQGAVANSCGLIVAADLFIPGNGIPVDSVEIDMSVDPHKAREMGAKAMKLLVLWREDEPAEERLAMVDKFVRRCRSAGLVSIIEPVVRPPRRGWDFDRESAIVAAAAELGGTEADLYKAEMPLGGKGDEKTLLAACQQLNDQMKMPWVILSSGVDADIFGRAVSIAMKGGASGFLAGRAVWASVVGAQDPQTMLRDVSVPRLQRLAEIVDEGIAQR